MRPKKLDLSMVVASNAEYCPNPDEFYHKILLTDTAINSVRQLLNVKTTTKLASLSFGDSVIQEYDCAFTPTNSDLDAVDISVCPLSIMTEFCQADLEESFLSKWMQSGSNHADFGPQAFMKIYYDELIRATKNDIAKIAWQGDTTSTIAPYSRCTGWEYRLANDAAVIDVTGTTVTASNVITEVNKLIAVLPEALAGEYMDIAFYMAPNIVSAFRVASAAHNVNVMLDANAPLIYNGFKIYTAYGMSANTMVLTRPENLVFATDLVNDALEITTVAQRNTTLKDVISTRSDFKLGFWIVNPEEIVFYT